MAEAYNSLDFDVLAVDESIAKELQNQEYALDNSKKNQRNNTRELINRRPPRIDEDDDDIMIIDNDEDKIMPSLRTTREKQKQKELNMDEVIARQLQEELDLEYARKLEEDEKLKNSSSSSGGSRNIGFRIANEPDPYENLLRFIDDHESGNLGSSTRAPFLAPRFSTTRQSQNDNSTTGRITSTTTRSTAGEQHHPNRPIIQARRRDPNNPRINTFMYSSSSSSSNHHHIEPRNIHPLFGNLYRAAPNPLHHHMFHSRHSRNPNSLLEFNDGDFTPEDYDRLLQLDSSSKKSGLRKSELSNLAVFEYKPSSTENSNSVEDNDKTCSICYDDFVAKDKLIALTCLHKFHKKCITPWLTDNRTCPLCKKDAINGQ